MTYLNTGQVSGLRIVYDIQESNQGNRTKSIQTQKCQVEPANRTWCDLDPRSNYTVALTSYIAKGIRGKLGMRLKSFCKLGFFSGS